MKKFRKLFRRHSRVADSSHYFLLLQESPAPLHSCSEKIRGSKVRLEAVPPGHLPVYVGEVMERFVVSTRLLNHPMFAKLLDESAQEYGYNQQGALRIPCHVDVFERVVEALRVGDI
ncbi:auxin-responsive protein SAUR71-like [Diospyros lotus]|uniref:auxin-responsive protein SAUR71-like n=1 Tax=Diospyros lotus TaxID=55363 RepID=UPI00224E790D|nr:auxin-responsive protein SAUR71-like [Diospyros lotus]XP_052208238.1 auxin-responsive protein SAUR71-like [Diospyros lotus]